MYTPLEKGSKYVDTVSQLTFQRSRNTLHFLKKNDVTVLVRRKDKPIHRLYIYVTIQQHVIVFKLLIIIDLTLHLPD